MTTEKVMAVLAALNHPGILLFMLPLKFFYQGGFRGNVTYKITKGNKNIVLVFLLMNILIIKYN